MYFPLSFLGFFLSFFLFYFVYLSNLYAQCRARTPNPEIKSPMPLCEPARLPTPNLSNFLKIEKLGIFV